MDLTIIISNMKETELTCSKCETQSFDLSQICYYENEIDIDINNAAAKDNNHKSRLLTLLEHSNNYFKDGSY